MARTESKIYHLLLSAGEHSAVVAAHRRLVLSEPWRGITLSLAVRNMLAMGLDAKTAGFEISGPKRKVLSVRLPERLVERIEALSRATGTKWHRVARKALLGGVVLVLPPSQDAIAEIESAIRG